MASTEPAAARAAGADDGSGRGALVAATIGAGLVTACVPVPVAGWVLLALVAAAWNRVTRPDAAAWRRGLRAWSVTVAGSVLAACALGGTNAVVAGPLGPAAARATRAWIAGTGAAPGVGTLAVLAGATLAAALVAGRLGAVVALAAVLHRAAVVSATIWGASDNLILAAPAALVPWEVATAVGLTVLVGLMTASPDGSGVRGRLRALEEALRAPRPRRSGAPAALALVILGLLLRLAASGTWAAMAAARAVTR